MFSESVDGISVSRLKNRFIARQLTRHPWIAKHLMNRIRPVTTEYEVPWTLVPKLLASCRVALITTAGVHHRDISRFDMLDRDGDPTYRVIDARRSIQTLMITTEKRSGSR